MSSQISRSETSLPSIHEVLPEHFPPASRIPPSSHPLRGQRESTARRPRAMTYSPDTTNNLRYRGTLEAERSVRGDTLADQRYVAQESIDGRRVDRLVNDHAQHSSQTALTRNVASDYQQGARPSDLSQERSPSYHEPATIPGASPSDIRRSADVSQAPYTLTTHWSHGGSPPMKADPITRKRDDDKKHPCPYCQRRFNRPSSLAIHINTHTGARPYECPKCGRLFSVNSNMRRHYRNHSSASDLPPSPPFQTTCSTGLPNHPYAFSTSRSPETTSHLYSYESDSEFEDSSTVTLYRHHGHDLEQSFARCRLRSASTSEDNHQLQSIPRRSVSFNLLDPISTTLRPATYDVVRGK